MEAHPWYRSVSRELDQPGRYAQKCFNSHANRRGPNICERGRSSCSGPTPSLGPMLIVRCEAKSCQSSNVHQSTKNSGHSFATRITISRCERCHGDTIHTAQHQPKCYPPQLLVCIHPKKSMCSYLHRDGAPADTPRKTAVSHDNLLSRHGLGCFHPKRFSNHFVEEGEYVEDEVVRVTSKRQDKHGLCMR